MGQRSYDGWLTGSGMMQWHNHYPWATCHELPVAGALPCTLLTGIEIANSNSKLFCLTLCTEAGRNPGPRGIQRPPTSSKPSWNLIFFGFATENRGTIIIYEHTRVGTGLYCTALAVHCPKHPQQGIKAMVATLDAAECVDRIQRHYFLHPVEQTDTVAGWRMAEKSPSHARDVSECAAGRSRH